VDPFSVSGWSSKVNTQFNYTPWKARPHGRFEKLEKKEFRRIPAQFREPAVSVLSKALGKFDNMVQLKGMLTS
jgi:hypothetical protein